jgi:two-component system sensor histidine kinase/response regulator
MSNEISYPETPAVPKFPAKPIGMDIEWQQKFKAAGSASLHYLERIKGIGFTIAIDDYEKRKLGIFNQLEFFPAADRHRHPGRRADTQPAIPGNGLGGGLYAGLRQRARTGIERPAILPGPDRLFRPLPFCYQHRLFLGVQPGRRIVLHPLWHPVGILYPGHQPDAIRPGLSMVSYFVLAVVCKNYTYQLATANLSFYLFNQVLALAFIFYGLFLIKKENTGYQYSILSKRKRSRPPENCWNSRPKS